MSQHYLAMNQGLRVFPLSLVACLTFWLGISALLVSPALAQVNGPGPSPSNLFDTVLSLPGDEAVITGVNYESIGGVVGQTTQLNVDDDGAAGRNFDVLAGGELNISGGFVPSGLIAHDGSEVNISGGSVGTIFRARDGSVVNISGGFVGYSFQANDGSEVNISGGMWGKSFHAFEGSDVELVGGEFKLNGEAFTDSTISVGVDDVFTGTLADGSPFIFANYGIGDELNSVSLTSPALPLPEASLIPMIVTTPLNSGPRGLREGQSLTLQAGGQLYNDFQVVGATLNVDGGEVGSNLEVAGSGSVNISGGSVVSLIAYEGSEVNISGGALRISGSDGTAIGSTVNISGGTLGSFDVTGGSLNITGGNIINSIRVRDSETIISGGSIGGISAYDGSEVSISGDYVGSSCRAYDGSEVNISGGTVGRRFLAGDGSVVNIRGGSVADADGFWADSGSAVNLFGSDFVLDGVLLDDLVLGEAFTILDREVTLSGRLADGTTTFSYDLNSEFIQGDPLRDKFAPGATLTLTLVTPVLLGDANLDGAVSFLDISPFAAILTRGHYLAEADCNQDGVVDLLDIPEFIDILLNT